MNFFEPIADGIYLLKTPFSVVWSGVVLVRGAENILIDAGADAETVDTRIVPALNALGMQPTDIDWLTVTHCHGDHIGGLPRLKEVTGARVAAYDRSVPKLADPKPYSADVRAAFPADSPAVPSGLCSVPADGSIPDGGTLGDLRLIASPGHDDDCVCWYHAPTQTLITGDSVQGNGTPTQGVAFYRNLPDYIRTIRKLQPMAIEHLVCAHDYDGIGAVIHGRDNVRRALADCMAQVERYDAFVRAAGDGADIAETADRMIAAMGCGTPEKRFMAMYTVRAHQRGTAASMLRKAVLITGASHGIGAAAAVAFAKAGYNVGVNYCSTPDGAVDTAEKCRAAGAEAEIFQADVRDRDACERMIADFIARFGKIDVLINNAGGALKIPGGTEGRFEEMPLDYWDSQIALNLSAAAYTARFAAADMIARCARGKIINVSSIHSEVTWVHRRMLPYSAAKGGLNMLTKALGVELIQHGINVNGVAPGLIFTKLAERYSPADLASFRRKIPFGNGGTVDDITPMLLFLADDEKSRFIVGQTFMIDGGQSIDGSIESMNFQF